MSKMSDIQVQIQEVETVSKQAVIDAFKVWLIDNNDMRRFEEVVRDLTPVTPTIPKGHWIEEDLFDGDLAYRCSECNELFCLECGTPKDNEYSFCPNCGTDMREGEA